MIRWKVDILYIYIYIYLLLRWFGLILGIGLFYKISGVGGLPGACVSCNMATSGFYQGTVLTHNVSLGQDLQNGLNVRKHEIHTPNSKVVPPAAFFLNVSRQGTSKSMVCPIHHPIHPTFRIQGFGN